MNYQKIYDSLILSAKANPPILDSESHHIIPRCLEGSDDPSNLVSLSMRQHYIAHLLLTKIYPKNPKLHLAFLLMHKQHLVIKNSHFYEISKGAWIEQMRLNNPMKNPEVAKRMSDTLKARNLPGRIPSQEERDEASKRMTENNPMSGTMPWENGRAKHTAEHWKKADQAFVIWQEGSSRYKAAKQLEIGTKTAENMYKKFKAGWVPTNDQLWLSFKETE